MRTGHQQDRAPVRLPFQPVYERLPGVGCLTKARVVAMRTGQSVRTAHRQLLRARESGLTPQAADTWAAFVGVHPVTVWGHRAWNTAWDAVELHDAQRRRRRPRLRASA